MRYKLKRPYSERTYLPTAFRGEVIDLSGLGFEKTIPASEAGPERKVTIRGANQQDLEALYLAGGSHLIEKVEKQKKVYAKKDPDEQHFTERTEDDGDNTGAEF